jgi:hypothetical protein
VDSDGDGYQPLQENVESVRIAVGDQLGGIVPNSLIVSKAEASFANKQLRLLENSVVAGWCRCRTALVVGGGVGFQPEAVSENNRPRSVVLRVMAQQPL